MFRRQTQHGASLFIVPASSVHAHVHSDKPCSDLNCLMAHYSVSKRNVGILIFYFRETVSVWNPPTDGRFLKNESLQVCENGRVHYNTVMSYFSHCLRYTWYIWCFWGWTYQVVSLKVKLLLCSTKYHVMKTRGEVEIQLHEFLISPLDRGEWSTSRLGRFTTRKRAPVPTG
jgi:hypothetical protein